MTPRFVRLLVGFALLLVGTAASAGPQVTTGMITGSVKDPQGGLVPGATAVLTSVERGTSNLASLATSAAATNLPFDANNEVISTRSQPKNAGFGVVTGYQSPRTVQLQIRFGF